MIANFDVGAVEGADGDGAVQRELHVAGAGGLHAGGRYLLGEVGGADQAFGERNAVVRHEYDLETVADDRILVHQACDVVRELDDELGALVAAGRLAGEDLDAVRPRRVRFSPDRLPQRDGFEDVEELALVLMDALDVNVEQRGRLDRDAGQVAKQAREPLLVLRPHGGVAAGEFRVGRFLFQPREAFRIVQHAVAELLAQQRHQPFVRLEQPAAEADAVGLVDDPRRRNLGEIAEHGLAQKPGVQRRDAVDAMGADEGEMPHADAAVRVLVDQRDAGDEAGFGVAALVRGLQVQPVDQVDDLQVPRQKPAEQRHRPAFERLGEQGVIGVAQRRAGDGPGLLP